MTDAGAASACSSIAENSSDSALAAAGARLATKMQAADPGAVLLFAPGVNINGTALVDGLAAGLTPGVRILGDGREVFGVAEVPIYFGDFDADLYPEHMLA